MKYDYSKLRGRITEKCGTIGEFAKRIELSTKSVSAKLNNKKGWKQAEMERACDVDVLDLDCKEIEQYFFTKQVQNIEH